MKQARASVGRKIPKAEDRSSKRLADPQNLLFRFTDSLYRAESAAEVYDAALDAICEGLGCARASILLFDITGVMRFVAWRGLSQGYRAAVDGHSPWRQGDSDPQPICIEDIALSSESDEIKATVASEGICGLAFIPLTVGGTVAGKFMVYYDVARLFTEQERELALIIARQLGFALEREAGESDARRLAAVVDSSQDAIISKRLDGTVTSWNQAAQQLFGYTAEEMIGQNITILFPPDRVAEEALILSKIAVGERVEHFETVRRCKDGSLVDISLTVSPLRDSRGRVIGASKIARDVAEQRRAIDQQALLLREMDHRVKNLFALAAGLVQLSARNAETPGALAQSVVNRLTALSRAHSLTMPLGLDGRADGGALGLHALIGAILQPFGASEKEGPIDISGDDVHLPGSLVTSLALLLYELATNAVKYGSLSVPAGRVSIQCHLKDGSLALDWKEQGGPPVGTRASDGFGTRLVAVTARQLGEVTHHWEEDGLRVKILVQRV